MAEERNLGGRPQTFETPEQMDGLINNYFGDCVKRRRAPNISGLALALGFSNRRSVYDYLKKEGFSHTLGRASLLIEDETYQKVADGSLSPAFGIFVLKSHGWKEELNGEEVGKALGDFLLFKLGQNGNNNSKSTSCPTEGSGQSISE